MDNCALAVEDCVAAKEDGTATMEDCAVEVIVVGLCGVWDFVGCGTSGWWHF